MKVILWCNGELPSETIAREIMSSTSLIFGVDGGADKAIPQTMSEELFLDPLTAIRQIYFLKTTA